MRAEWYGAARAVADGTSAPGEGSKYAQGGVGPLVLSPSKYERRVGRCLYDRGHG